MYSLGRKVAICALTLLLVGGGIDLRAQSARPTPTPPIFVPRPFGAIPAPTPTPQHKSPTDEEEKPIPRAWIIGGAIAAALVLAGLLYGAARAWRSSNLFDRQYTFPVTREAAL